MDDSLCFTLFIILLLGRVVWETHQIFFVPYEWLYRYEERMRWWMRRDFDISLRSDNREDILRRYRMFYVVMCGVLLIITGIMVASLFSG